MLRMRKGSVHNGIESMEEPRQHCYLWVHGSLFSFGGTIHIEYIVSGAPKTPFHKEHSGVLLLFYIHVYIT